MSKAKIIHIKESSKELKQLQKNQPLTIIKRINMLIELKKNGVDGISKRQLSKLIGVDPNSIQSWRTLYINQGIKGIVSHGRIGFKPSLITKEEHKKIESKLNQATNALRGYKELVQWIKDEFDKEIKYTTVVEYAKRHFGSKIKVARKSHILKDEAAATSFKKNFGQIIQEVIFRIDHKFESVNLYFQDESRFGLFTKNGRALTAKGVKPICLFQQVFQSTYLFGAFSPINGKRFLLELPFCNNDTFQIYLNEFSEQDPNEYKIIVLDNGAFHKAKALQIPHNISLVFLPPYSPELNPAERIWETLKANFTGCVFKNLDLLSDFIKKEVIQLSEKSSFPIVRTAIFLNP